MTTSPHIARSLSLHPDTDGFSSSPDPLAAPVHDENIYLRSTPRKGVSPSPRKGRTTQALEDITRLRPQKGRASSTLPSRSPSSSQSGHFLSPWKIRVTVEAEPDGEDFGKVKSISKTTTVPLRDTTPLPKDSRVQGRTRSRSRKLGSKRITTPTPKSQAPQRNRVNLSRLSNLDTSFLDSDDVETQSMLKKDLRGRSSTKTSEIVEHVSANENTMLRQQESPKVSEASPSSLDTKLGAGSVAVVAETEWSLKLGELDLDQTTVCSRTISPNTASMPGTEEACRDNEMAAVVAATTATSFTTTDDDKGQTIAANAMTYPTPDTSVQDETEAIRPQSDPTGEHDGFDTILESEGFTMIDLESLPSARRFVTSTEVPEPPQEQPLAEIEINADLVQPRPVSSPALAPRSSLSAVSPPTCLSNLNKQPPAPMPSYIAPPEDGESDLSSTVPSSPPMRCTQPTSSSRSVQPAASPLHETHTPVCPERSSPKLPRPPKQSQKDKELVANEVVQPDPPGLARVARAGIALQRLLSPNSKKPPSKASAIAKVANPENYSVCTPKERSDKLFIGFDSGARRELRAGLRFGEELAKRQRMCSPSSSSSSFGHGAPAVAELQSQQETDSAWRGETMTRHRCSDSQETRLTSEDWHNGVSQGSPGSQTLDTPCGANMSCGSIMFLDAEARERRWQLERAATSQQVEDANASQVIVIDSDSDHESHEMNARPFAMEPNPTSSVIREADEDIWLAQARVPASFPQLVREDQFLGVEQIRQRERAKKAHSRPRGSLIPSPRKGKEDVDNTTMTAGDASGMFWQQPEDKEDAKSWMRHVSSTIDTGEAPTREPDVDKMHDRPSAAARSRPVATGEKCPLVYPGAQDYHQDTPFAAADDGEESLECEGELEDDKKLEFAPEMGALSTEDEDAHGGCFLERLPTKIPVNFNETDLSIRSDDPFQDNAQRKSASPSPFCPQTPRSAFKGSRATLSLVRISASPTPRKVAFSRHSLCLDESGLESSMRVRGGTVSPEPSIAGSDSRDDGAMAEHDDVGKDSVGEVADVGASVTKQDASVSWFSRLTGWGLRSVPASSDPSAISQPRRQQQQYSRTAKSNSCEKTIQWEPNGTATASTGPCITAAPSKVLGQGTDARMPPPPERLSSSGSFSDNHYKHLHILYLKTLKPTFTRPGSVRPSLLKHVGRRCYSGDGDFAWEITKLDAEVVERWIRSFEGRDARDAVTDWSAEEGRYRRVGWDELDLCMRLFSIVAGQEIRRERGARKEKPGLKKGSTTSGRTV